MNTEQPTAGAPLTVTPDITVELVTRMGDDGLIAAAARVSTVGLRHLQGTQNEIAGLLRYLCAHRHGSPFEHGAMTFRIHAPIFVFREWHRHRIGWSYNEESARYRQLDAVFWIPHAGRKLVPAEGSTSARPQFVAGTDEQAGRVALLLALAYERAYKTYEELLALGIDRGAARACLPVGIFSSMYATCNPRSLMHFLSLRTHDERAAFPSHPLAEIEEAARQMETIFAEHWPLTWEAFIAARRVAP